MKVNCDIGERGADHPVDRQLMELIDIANIACGGHAGDETSIHAFCQLAEQHDVTVTAHLSYPDRENFGRRSLDIPWNKLEASLDEQMNRINTSAVKFHGALYNDAAANPELAALLSDWLKRRKVQILIAPGDSELAQKVRATGITLWSETFAERGYCRKNNRLALLSRSEPNAVFQTLEKALQQSRLLADHKTALPDASIARIQSDTVCVHSDSPIALPLVQALTARPPFTITDPGLSRFVRRPQYGRQHLGVSPEGPQDRFSFETGHALLGSTNPQSLEFIIPPKITFTRPAQYILTGARFSGVEHARVLRAEAGEELSFGKLQHGLRGYLSWFSEGSEHIGKRRPDLSQLITWNDPDRCIRLTPGPESQWMKNPDLLVSKPWKISKDSGPMGIRLETIGPKLIRNEQQMISSPVADGTVQLTPNGPIVLMRSRQTVGGYPRIANVIEVDLDRLAQFRPGETVRFRGIEPDEACVLLAARHTAIASLAR